jgi:hypothetical protein
MASDPCAPWRIRDVVWDDLHRPLGAAQPPKLSDDFAVDLCLSRLRRDKAAVVRSSFGTAAWTVLQRCLDDPNNDDASNEDAPKHDGTNLPRKIAQWDHLQQLREECLSTDQKNFKHGNSAGSTRPTTVKITAKSASVSFLTNTSASSSSNNHVNHNASSSNGYNNSSNAATISSSSTRESAKATTASASAVMDSRAAVSRAVLCAAASIALQDLTPDFEGSHKLDPLDIPQNDTDDAASAVNMGSVILQAQAFGQRAIDQGLNASRRSSQRLAYQQSMALTTTKSCNEACAAGVLRNPFCIQVKEEEDDDDDDMEVDDEDDDDELDSSASSVPYNPNPDSATTAWADTCLPRFTEVLQKGTGHAVFCDLDWTQRHGRIANLMQTMAFEDKASADSTYFGPHLIVTTKPNVQAFCQEFEAMQASILPKGAVSSSLRVLHYAGSSSHRAKLRKTHFGNAQALGQPSSSFHVLVTSYQDLLSPDDYLDFAQQPWQMVILDEGFSWLAAAQSDPNSQLAQLWDQALFGTADAHIGLAASTTATSDWKFGKRHSSSKRKEALIGLSCRNRIVTTPSLNLSQKQRSMTLPGLLACIVPHFTDVIKEEWDRSRITHDTPSLNHLKKLVTRSIIVHDASCFGEGAPSLHDLAIKIMDGDVATEGEEQLVSGVPTPPRFISDEDFVNEGKISQSRRTALTWLSPWMRYELGRTSFNKISDLMKESGKHGHVCQEILPASVTTSSGASGAVIGSLAYRLGVRCGRSFGSEQGLRQHIAALHAPPGTWLCRTCGSDCGTSQARTHHERTCGQPEGIDEKRKETSAFGPPGVVGKKAKGSKKPAEPKDKDADGSFRVPGYRGVWVNPSGKHFVKTSKDPLRNDGGDIVYFDTVEEAARKHDKILKKETEKDTGAELNFKEDGSRVIYDDNTAASAAGRGVEMLGGGSNSVVPALSVINIKDLPKDVKPLLRDPRQTSRTGGNSKRHVYAYRGVCRQARKGHDRWQSQISFGGTNHYLGTFDSEWDAAAVYAWAHLILYGEEATKKAQQEGEEAAAAYEREKAAIASGEVLPAAPKPEKKKKPPKKRTKKTEEEGEEGDTKKAKKVPKASPACNGRKAKPGPKPKANSDLSLQPILALAVTKAPILGPRKSLKEHDDDALLKVASSRILMARLNGYCTTDVDHPPEIDAVYRPCVPVMPFTTRPAFGGAMLLGLNAGLFGWSVDTFASSCDFDSAEHEAQSLALLSDEYSQNGYNESFRSLIQGSVCVIGRASKSTEKACERLGLGLPVMGGSLGDIDCHIGGAMNSCSESAAMIQHLPTAASAFQLLANNDEDVVTLNGRRISVGMGSFPLFNEDICTIGARVFVFLVPANA